MTRSWRAMTAEERKEIKVRSRDSERLDAFTVFVLLGGLPGLGWFVGNVLGLSSSIGAWLGLVIGVIILLRIWWRLLAGARRVRARYRRDLDRGEVEVLELEVREALRVEEHCEEGVGFFLDIGEGSLLFLQLDISAVEDDEDDDGDGENVRMLFPLEKMTVVQTESGHILDFSHGGAYLPPARERTPLVAEEYEKLEELGRPRWRAPFIIKGSLSDWAVAPYDLDKP